MTMAYAERSGVLVKVSGRLVTVACYSCGVLFALPEEMEQNRRNDHGSFYCPNGHSQYFPGQSEAEKLQERLDREKRALAHTQDLLNAEKNSHAATKGALTKAKNRASAGVCQQCNRTFANVARHVASQHAEHDA